MANSHQHADDAHAGHGSMKSYMIGFVLSIILTAVPFGLVMFPTISKIATVWVVLIFAIVQVMVHLVYFLHLDRSAAQRSNVIAFAFAGMVILMLVGLSVWIMFSIHTVMMAK
jgi:cytochrome o ubiquinol oxidase operon protein cyoD